MFERYYKVMITRASEVQDKQGFPKQNVPTGFLAK